MWIKCFLCNVLIGVDIVLSEIMLCVVFENWWCVLQVVGFVVVGGLFGISGVVFVVYVLFDVWVVKFVVKINLIFVVIDKVMLFKDIMFYNNFYEFGIDKSDLVQNVGMLWLCLWCVSVEGEVQYLKVFDFDELLKFVLFEECVYWLCCVEGWLMVILWIGVLLFELIKCVQLIGNVKYVQFVMLVDLLQMLGLLMFVFDWLYLEGLCMDEVMNLLMLLMMGVYGQVLLNQNGVLVWIVVLWKYGFKSVKLFVKICFVDKQLKMSWNMYVVNEYGFYLNVNLNVDYLCWSQVIEWCIGEDGFFMLKCKMLMFNGYGDLVVLMYQGMDLKKNF